MADSSGPRFGGRGAQGKITAINGTTLTLDSTDFSGATSTVTVTTDADTKVTETVSGSVSDVAVGDNVLVVGTSTLGRGDRDEHRRQR